MVGHPERAGDQADLTCRQSQGIIGFGQLHQQHELITADPRQGVLAAQVFAQAQGHVPQQQIAHVVTKGVVDRLETIQVDEHQGEAAALLLHPVHGLVDTISQQYPVGQSGEGVVQGQLGQFPVGQGQGLGQLGGAGFQTRIENRRQQGDGQHRQGGDQHQIVQALAAQAVQGATKAAVAEPRPGHAGVVHADDGDAHDHRSACTSQTHVGGVLAQAKGNPQRRRRSADGNHQRSPEQRRVIVDAWLHSQRGHAGVVHGADPGTHDQRTERQLPRR
nr:hypothetical protein GCM10020185_67610 [Pseudomonas brassicacearum subsp. brassicacearum]